MDLSAEIDQLVESYGLKLEQRSSTSSGSAVILLTGATGSLGAHCLAKLASLSTVSRVICVNRAGKDPDNEDGPTRQLAALRIKGLILKKDDWTKVTVFQTNTASDLLGLTEVEYREICQSVTHVMHSAWPMDFKRELGSFKTSFQTLHNLLGLARRAHTINPLRRPRLLFISSIATVGQYTDVHGGRIVPEIAIDNVRCANVIGYAQAKLVCERILEQAAQNYASELEATYVRFGQLAGSTTNGFWNTDEHFAALVKSSQRINALPQMEGTFSWIPVDSAADVLSELLLFDKASAMVYHVENPVRQSWNDVLKVLASELHIDHSISLEHWLDSVTSAVDVDGEVNPAKKLEDFFRSDFERMASGKVIMGTDVSRSRSRTLANMDAVQGETISKYIQYWRSIGFLK